VCTSFNSDGLHGFIAYRDRRVVGCLLNFRATSAGNVNDLYNSITNKVPSVVNGFTYAIRNPKQKVQHHLAKVNYNYYFDETASLAVQYSFSLIND
jgi:hypothetical protein